MTQRYVCGFALDTERQQVLLVKKNRGPINMAGMYNGIGGKVNVGEGFRTAMSREFREECGIEVAPEDWTGFHQLRLRNGATVFFFVTVMSQERLAGYSSRTDEEVGRMFVDGVASWATKTFRSPNKKDYLQVLPDLAWLLPMAVQYSYPNLEMQNLGY